MDNLEIEVVHFLLTGTIALLILSIGFICIYIKWLRNLTKEQKKLVELERIHKQEVLENIIESVEAERTRIARDLHDHIGNTFALLSLILQKSKGEKTKEALLLVDNGLKNTRELVYQIMPPELKLFGLEYALEEICDRINKVITWLQNGRSNVNLSITVCVSNSLYTG